MGEGRGWRWVFAAAGATNLLVGLPLLAAPGAVYRLAGASAPATFEPALVGWFIAVFGAAYLLVATAPLRHRGIVQAALVGKLGAFTIVVAYWLAGRAPTIFAAGIVGDALWSAVFWLFLVRTARGARDAAP